MMRLPFALLLGLTLLLSACERENAPSRDSQSEDGRTLGTPASRGQHVEIDLPEIKKRGKLIALTRYNANSYFIYRGQPMGYEYELLHLFAEHLGVELQIKVPKTWPALFDSLNAGAGDIIAANLTVTKERARLVNFTDYLTTTKQVLVQRKPENWRKLKAHQIDKLLIRNQIALIGKRVYVRQSSSYYARLRNLSEELGGDIDIVPAADSLETEDLIRMVAKGEIDYTVADENIALINQAYYANIDVQTPVSFPQRLAWAVRSTSPRLQDAINAWLRKMKSAKEPTLYFIYDKYYKNRRSFRRRVDSEYYSKTGGKISKYDAMIKKYAAGIGWDWRLLASQVYQESQFDPNAKSWAGAIGLMQLLPRTARQYGIRDLRNPEQNIKAGTKQLQWLAEYWQGIEDAAERTKFILASYNAGQGHIQDARRLAKKYGRDPNRWDGQVEYFVLQKSKKKYFDDDAVKFGYVRGEEPVQYVRDILQRYEIYRQYF